ncbi:ATP-binding protein [Calditrichota bacterium]
MDTKDLQSVVETLNRDLEEKISQMSQVKMIARTMAVNLQEKDHFSKICHDFLDTFDAEMVCLFWFRKREPAGWWLEDWASHRDKYKPIQNLIAEADEGLLGWVRKQKSPNFVRDVSDEPILNIWGTSAPIKADLALVPLQIDEARDGMLVLINPTFKYSEKNIKFQLDIVSDLITTDVRNRLLYQGIKHAESEFQDLLNNQTDLAVLAYPDGVIRDCNRLFRDFLSVDEDVKGKYITDYIIDDSEPPFDDCWEMLLAGDDVEDFKTALQSSDGSKIETSITGSVRHAPDGKISVVILYFRTSGARQTSAVPSGGAQAVDMALSQQISQIEEMVTGLSHNLLEPVHGLLNYLLVNGKELKHNPGIEKLVDTSSSIADTLKGIEERRRQAPGEASTIDINGLIESEISIINSQPALKDRIKWKIDLDRKIPMLKARWHDIAKAVSVVLFNAVDAVLESHESDVTVSTKFDSDRELVFVSITDTGPGVPDEIRHRLFDPFFTTKTFNSSASSQISSGSGLGLSTAESIIKTYGGSISFDSEMSVGSTFHLVIPARPVEG